MGVSFQHTTPTPVSGERRAIGVRPSRESYRGIRFGSLIDNVSPLRVSDNAVRLVTFLVFGVREYNVNLIGPLNVVCVRVDDRVEEARSVTWFGEGGLFICDVQVDDVADYALWRDTA